MKYALGIDIGGTNFRIGVIGENGELIGFEKKSSKIFNDCGVVEILESEIISYLKKKRNGRKNIRRCDRYTVNCK